MPQSFPPVAFPSTESNLKPQQPIPRAPYLPFRRISLPTAPTLLHRDSVISVASFDSLPEDEVAAPPMPRNRQQQRPLISARAFSKRKTDEATDAKRRKVIHEFYETEKAYVDGLELIYQHFLTPIISSLDTDTPLLDRPTMTAVFSNFIDIWNLHRSFFSSLTTFLPNDNSDPPPISPILLSHFPYLSLYTPFVTSFPNVISSLSDLMNSSSSTYNPAFTSFLQAQEADERCAKLKLRDWLLTIVQRCPRYLLLLKDLISCTPPEETEHSQLTAVHTLVAKITLSLNTSLHTHAQTLSLLALQRNTPNLPFQLIAPGRTLLKRGALLQIELSDQPRQREFLLFSDCLLWLAPEDTLWNMMNLKSDWLSKLNTGADSTNNNNNNNNNPSSSSIFPPNRRPPMARLRSKSEAELPTIVNITPQKTTQSALPPPVRKSHYHHPVPDSSQFQNKNNHSRAHTQGHADERWVFKGNLELVDLEIVVFSPAREEGEERRFEVLSPEGSFVVYASSESDRDEWTTAIRQAKAQQLISLNVTHPNSTLNSSAATAAHVRKRLQALPFPPSDERIGTLGWNSSSEIREAVRAKGKDKIKKPKDKGKKERRGRVEHWVPAIWIPDEKTEGCMRCGRTFGWRRRRHHCRLCGRCVCAACSGRTFFIAEVNTNPNKSSARKDDLNSKPARACEACYETVFPLLDQATEHDEDDNILSDGESRHRHAPPAASSSTSSTITSLTNFPSWLSMPSLPLSYTSPDALMAINPIQPQLAEIQAQDRRRSGDYGRQDNNKFSRLSKTPAPRPRSYHQILEDFQRFNLESPLEEDDGDTFDDDGGTTATSSTSDDRGSLVSSKRHTVVNLSTSPRKEDTVRRHKRFSMPAVALQTTSVTARTTTTTESGIRPGVRSPRFSLMLGGKTHDPSRKRQNPMRPSNEEPADLGTGLAAGRLSELLSRATK